MPRYYCTNLSLFSDFETVDGQGLRGKLDVNEEMPENISIVATVSRFNGIPGLKLHLYVNLELVAQSPQTVSCQTQDTYELRYNFDATHAVIDYMVIRLTYTHSDLPREVQLVSHSHRFNNKQGMNSKKNVTSSNITSTFGIPIDKEIRFRSRRYTE